MPKALQLNKEDIIVEEIKEPEVLPLWRGRGKVEINGVFEKDEKSKEFTDYLCSQTGEINIHHLITFNGLNNLTITSFKLTYKLFNEYGELSKKLEFTQSNNYQSGKPIEVDFYTLLLSYESLSKYQYDSIAALALTDVEVVTDNGIFVYGDDEDPIVYSSKTLSIEEVLEQKKNDSTFMSKFKDFFTL